MARMHLGSFGTRRDAVDADFDYFGETIRVHPDASDLHHAELMIIAAGIELGDDYDGDDPDGWTAEQRALTQKANDAAVHALQGQVHPDDWDRFFKTAKANRQQLLDLIELSKQVSGLVAGFPTGQLSDSSAGQPNTKPKSKAGSSRRAVRTARRTLELLDGRPDLQMAAVHAYEAKTAESG